MPLEIFIIRVSAAFRFCPMIGISIADADQVLAHLGDLAAEIGERASGIPGRRRHRPDRRSATAFCRSASSSSWPRSSAICPAAISIFSPCRLCRIAVACWSSSSTATVEIRLGLARLGLLPIHQVEEFLAIFGKAFERGMSIGGRADQPADKPLARGRVSGIGLGLQILNPQNFHAVDDARRDATDFAGIAQSYAGQQLPRGLGDAAPVRRRHATAGSRYSRKSIFAAEACAAARSSGLRLATSTRRSGSGSGASRLSATVGSRATGATARGGAGGASRLSKIERSSGLVGSLPDTISSPEMFDHPTPLRFRNRKDKRYSAQGVPRHLPKRLRPVHLQSISENTRRMMEHGIARASEILTSWQRPHPFTTERSKSRPMRAVPSRWPGLFNGRRPATYIAVTNEGEAEFERPAPDCVVPGEGFEPPTFGLQNRCTATVLTRHSRVDSRGRGGGQSGRGVGRLVRPGRCRLRSIGFAAAPPEAAPEPGARALAQALERHVEHRDHEDARSRSPRSCRRTPACRHRAG